MYKQETDGKSSQLKLGCKKTRVSKNRTYPHYKNIGQNGRIQEKKTDNTFYKGEGIQGNNPIQRKMGFELEVESIRIHKTTGPYPKELTVPNSDDVIHSGTSNGVGWVLSPDGPPGDKEKHYAEFITDPVEIEREEDLAKLPAIIDEIIFYIDILPEDKPFSVGDYEVKKLKEADRLGNIHFTSGVALEKLIDKFIQIEDNYEEMYYKDNSYKSDKKWIMDVVKSEKDPAIQGFIFLIAKYIRDIKDAEQVQVVNAMTLGYRNISSPKGALKMLSRTNIGDIRNVMIILDSNKFRDNIYKLSNTTAETSLFGYMGIDKKHPNRTIEGVDAKFTVKQWLDKLREEFKDFSWIDRELPIEKKKNDDGGRPTVVPIEFRGIGEHPKSQWKAKVEKLVNILKDANE